jgi:hypothetical protein
MICNANASIDAALQYSDCRINQMVAAGAPAEAVNFTRNFARQFQSEVAIMRDYKNIGSADLITVLHPFRPTFVNGRQVGVLTSLLLVSHDRGSPYFSDPSNIDKKEMEQSPWYRMLKQQYPMLRLLPHQGPFQNWLEVERQADGTLKHREGYLVTDGIHENRFLGSALFELDFDAQGKFSKTKFLGAPLA